MFVLLLGPEVVACGVYLTPARLDGWRDGGFLSREWGEGKKGKGGLGKKSIPGEVFCFESYRFINRDDHSYQTSPSKKKTSMEFAELGHVFFLWIFIIWLK